MGFTLLAMRAPNCCCFVGVELEKVPNVAQAKRIVPQIGAIAKKVPRIAGGFHGLWRWEKASGRRQGTWKVAPTPARSERNLFP
jgi:hypothetical protein